MESLRQCAIFAHPCRSRHDHAPHCSEAVALLHSCVFEISIGMRRVTYCAAPGHLVHDCRHGHWNRGCSRLGPQVGMGNRPRATQYHVRFHGQSFRGRSCEQGTDNQSLILALMQRAFIKVVTSHYRARTSMQHSPLRSSLAYTHARMQLTLHAAQN